MLTVGHGTHEQDAFAALLRGAGVDHLVDVRTAPGSRRCPWFGRDRLAEWIPEAGIAYHHEADLGGFRKPLPDSPNAGWRNDSFRGYADYMRTPPFWVALDRVLALDGPVAVMCSESVWWRCHRRLIADAVTVVRDLPVDHLMPDGRTAPHRPTEGVVRDGDLLRYPGRIPKRRDSGVSVIAGNCSVATVDALVNSPYGHPVRTTFAPRGVLFSMNRLRNAARLLAVGTGLLSTLVTATQANAATPIYPMIAITVTARAGQTPTYTVTAQAPGPWSCSQPTWGLGTFVVACTPPPAPDGFVNTCIWNAVTVTSGGIPGFGPLSARANCDGDPGAATSTNTGGTNAAAAFPNLAFGTAYCSVSGGINEPAMRPWIVNCTTNH